MSASGFASLPYGVRAAGCLIMGTVLVVRTLREKPNNLIGAYTFVFWFYGIGIFALLEEYTTLPPQVMTPLLIIINALAVLFLIIAFYRDYRYGDDRARSRVITLLKKLGGVVLFLFLLIFGTAFVLKLFR